MPVCCVEGQSKRSALVQAVPIYMYEKINGSCAWYITKDAEFHLQR